MTKRELKIHISTGGDTHEFRFGPTKPDGLFGVISSPQEFMRIMADAQLGVDVLTLIQLMVEHFGLECPDNLDDSLARKYYKIQGQFERRTGGFSDWLFDQLDRERRRRKE